jgi:hypothetical protein
MLRLVAATALTVHGLLHYLGTAALWRLTDVQAYPYTTTVLDGRVDVGQTGVTVLGALWLLGGALYVSAGLAVALASRRTLPVLAGAAVVSGVLCLLGMPSTAPGATVDGVLLALAGLVWLFTRRTGAAARDAADMTGSDERQAAAEEPAGGRPQPRFGGSA